MRIFLGVFGVFLALAAAFGFQREYATAMTVRDTSFRVIEKLAADVPPRPISWRGIRAVMLACHEAQTDAALAFQPGAVRDSLMANCAASARMVLAGAPTTSSAQLVLAASARHLDQPDMMVERLRLSQVTGPREGWLAARRVNLITPHLEGVTPLGHEIWQRDVALLLEERWGRTIVAEIFARNEALRPAIEDVVALMPNDAQRDFVALVRRAIQAQNAPF